MIELKQVNFRYENSKTKTLRNIDLKISKGDIVAVVGPSGGGKSTLLRIIAGLEKPIGGEITFGGNIFSNDIVFIPPEKRGEGMVFQDYALFPHMTVRKNIEYGLRGMKKSAVKKRVEEVLELVKLEGMESRYPDELSGGQQQRVALARAIAPNPKVLLLDEPFSNLDTHLLRKVRTELFEIIDNLKMTTILVTHNPEDASAVANRTVTIENGYASEAV